MHEKSLILIDGPHGSGSTRVSRATAETLKRADVSIEHISTGDRIRAIGRGALASAYTQDILDHYAAFDTTVPIENSLMANLIDESFQEHAQAQLLILDGYPRYESQADDIVRLAEAHQRIIRGMIVTQADWETCIARMIQRGQKHPERALTREQAVDRLAIHTVSFPDVIASLEEADIPIHYIDTEGPKEVTNRLALRAIRSFYEPGQLSHQKTAS